ncbi:Gfo/Idh/MocA family oxidoreductase [Aliiroseovarius sp. Z3]|uniref:Gfo/Idh/MocA family protein n=1 Tax=Aliiroseovarius sp. Z3 TaxID=2811402 RepID=UPI0023B35833|nr:Gfo/Idh/MocA family oxidoreductase [Aliiroseovarius sp. Z3]MDE9451678.1 Gfo/Idh/MocA family oxidoreductase [Aliiroseovarius sp. Z3]
MTGGYRAPIRWGMVGGGEGAFIGGVHRIAARLDGQFDLVAGAFSSQPERARRSGEALGISADRNYESFEEMASAEARRPDGIQAVSIVTPNHMHLPVASAFLRAGIHVICDKPLTTSVEAAREFQAEHKDSDALFVLTHNYPGTPMVRQAREMVSQGVLGTLRHVQVEYAQDWLTEPADSGNKQAAWRTDTSKTGAAGALGDIGTHAYQLACFVTGQRAIQVAADLTSFVPGRPVDDNASVLLRFDDGAKGILWASQVAPGNENALSIRVYGDKGGLEWRQEDPNRLYFTPFGEPKQILTRGGAAATSSAISATRLPGGHPEGYLEAFATIYSDIADEIRLHRSGPSLSQHSLLVDLEEGTHGMAFVDACLRSSTANGIWLSI